MITDAANGVYRADNHLVLHNPGGNESLHVLVRPLAKRQIEVREDQPDGRVLLIVSEPGACPPLPPQMLSQVFLLSAAESRLVAALCSGRSLNEYAGLQGLSVETARSQLKQVLAKTQVHRQADLTRLVYSSVIAQVLEREDSG
jgi:DNA-binding CsgD family transcriptional regulator